jgi:hypothetical protein
LAAHPDPTLAAQLRDQGFAFVAAAAFKAGLPDTVLNEWPRFAASWNDLGVDTYMADGGRYRRRRFASFAVGHAVGASGITRKPHHPHYQSRDYNTLNGGIERWFEPIAPAIAQHPLLLAVLRYCFDLFDGLTPEATRPEQWHVECHQFRIEAKTGEPAQPTPEGLHRDGVDWVLVLLVARVNIAEGVTTIYADDRQPVGPKGSFTLVDPLDAAFVDDSRVYHGVTAVRAVDASQPAYRDVLVVTFRRA